AAGAARAARASGVSRAGPAGARPPTRLGVAGDPPPPPPTHRHGDHWQALEEVVAATGARTYAGAYDAEGIPVPTDVPVEDGDTIRVGRVELTARRLVGHTPGSIALVYDDPHGHPHVFTGDCLFPGGVGNTWKDPEAFASLIHDVETKLFAALPDESWVYPGHGRDTTLGDERPHLAEWRERGW
ncbi:MBL fold metallo-hydrolase, partial [Streptomyces sp. NPDC057540]|uniref:MBL fold metallo-hydrolase n=1 Tax=Streptomyces sp. NPDC057540 TaxID=3346160 RepID=UPI0036D11A5B